MVSPMQQVDDLEDKGLDIEAETMAEDADFESKGIDIEEDAAKLKEEPSWLETVGDVLVQSGLGALQVYTWPADVLKIGMIGEGLADLDEVEAAFEKEGKPFDREKYVADVFNYAQYIPTQDLAEQSFEGLTGLSLEPKTEAGRRVKQAVTIAGFTKGGLAKKATAGAISAGTTEVLKKAGVGEGKAGLIGDLASITPQVLSKIPRVLSQEAKQLQTQAQKYSLPFLEYMTKERAPELKGRLFKNTQERLKETFNLTADQALKKIVKDEIPMSRLRERGINLDQLGEHAYEETLKLARAKPQIISTDPIVKNIDAEIAKIKSKAPNPSEAEKAAIQLLEDQRDVLKVSKPNSEQLINQHINYNADQKQIYKKPEFTGKEDAVRKSYEFLKQELVNAMEKQGSSDVANGFKAANKIYHETSKLKQVESMLQSTFKDGDFSPQKLDKLLNSKKGKFLRRNLGPKGMQEIEEIAKYTKEAEEKMARFIELKSPTIAEEVSKLGPIAPLLFTKYKVLAGVVSLAKPLASLVKGKLLTRAATREVYKITMKHAADGAFNLLKKDFIDLGEAIREEWGSEEDFINAAMEELDISGEE